MVLTIFIYRLWFRFCGTDNWLQSNEQEKNIYPCVSITFFIKLMSHCIYLQFVHISSMKLFLFLINAWYTKLCHIFLFSVTVTRICMFKGRTTNKLKIIWEKSRTDYERIALSLTIFSQIWLLRIIIHCLHFLWI